MAFPPVTGTRSPRVVIVGAGMAGIAAAQRLQRLASSRFQLTILEASERIGGRICSSEFNGERMELGATWIHGIEGSPIFKVATRIGAMDGGDQPWEGQDGVLRDELVRTEDGLDVDENIVEPVIDLFNDLLEEIKDVKYCRASPDDSVGTFLRNEFDKFLIEKQRAAESVDPGCCNSPWNNEKSLKQAEGVFSSKEYMERIVTGADCLTELDMVGYQEYKEFGGEHRTIGKGYSTVLGELSRVLPDQTIQLRKKVEKILWNQTTTTFPVKIHCQDGSFVEADHVIVTVSLGVLKQATLPPSLNNKVSVKEEGEAQIVHVDDDAVVGGGLFNPPLPVWKLDPIAKLGYGVVNKVFTAMEPANGGVHKPLHFIFGSEDQKQPCAAAEGPAWVRKSFSIYPINRKSHVLVTWFAGREALLSELQTDQDIVRGITDALKNFGYPQDTSCRGLLRSKWGTDPLFQGSYSYVKNGSTCDDIDLLAEPLPTSRNNDLFASAAGGIENRPMQLLFAGEATDRHYYSTVHGAYLSGLREADRLLQHYEVI